MGRRGEGQWKGIEGDGMGGGNGGGGDGEGIEGWGRDR